MFKLSKRILVVISVLSLSWLTAQVASDKKKYAYCMEGMYIELDNACFDAILQERKGNIKFKERKHVCDSLGVKVTSKRYEEVTDFLLTARYARSLKACVK